MNFGVTWGCLHLLTHKKYQFKFPDQTKTNKKVVMKLNFKFIYFMNITDPYT